MVRSGQAEGYAAGGVAVGGGVTEPTIVALEIRHLRQHQGQKLVHALDVDDLQLLAGLLGDVDDVPCGYARA